jgi:hypothetical protein
LDGSGGGLNGGPKRRRFETAFAGSAENFGSFAGSAADAALRPAGPKRNDAA